MFRSPWLLLVACLAIAPAPAWGGIGTVISDFRLPDAYGQQRSLSDYGAADAIVVVFLGVECPLAKLYGPRLAAIAADYADRNVTVIGVNANRQDSLTELAAYGRRSGIEFPLLKDNHAEAAELFGATRTPEAFVLDRQRVVRYQGRIDDQYDVGAVRKAPSQRFVREALDAVLDDQDVPTPETRAVGCVIGRPREPDADAAVTYSEHVAPILERHCVECHRDGEIAPFVLRGYEEVAGWADTIAEVVRDQRMPPWHANPAHGDFANARLLSAEEKQTLYDWADAGAPEGDPAKLPDEREFVTGWRLPREPDLVVAMRDEPYRVAAQGVIDYQYFAVDPGFTEDKWVQAADIVPGDRSVVHHVIVFVSPPADRPQRGLGWLTAYVPGQSSMTLPEGRARFVAAGSKFVFQMHYTPTGAEAEDQTKMGLVFADPATVTEEVVTLEAVNSKFEIPPGDPDYHVSASRDHFPAGATLIGLAPHMHFRGKSFRMVAEFPNADSPEAKSRVLLDVPHYDFNWQTNYELADPVTIPAGMRIDCEASFDNSAGNPFNPDPTAAVRWGDQSFEEMMIGFFEIAAPVGSLKQGDHIEEASEGVRMEALALTQRLFEKHDDGDGKLQRRELPHAFAIFAFDRYDLDDDQVLTPEEVFKSALADARR
ncbi:Thiol-disulfide oxidoreductase ResA [Botrimarina colliarenosi]|uniref:Thiol-disulfide oxidoreductase ResA n=1 Tax=Botrimarina colliarenosi TaxID=2528001 RepID=A0A5C6AGT7_9BACT|nr:redoxin domain-containing protein [Botrimarina colliarenosi]TWT99252.1 Thiol-disulfide oxidoreductase ResA [Botrimarina colliarenosi]